MKKSFIIKKSVIAKSVLLSILACVSACILACQSSKSILRQTIEQKSEEESKGTLLGDLFASEAKNISRPADFVVDLNDLQKPAVWNKNDYGRSIKLTDD